LGKRWWILGCVLVAAGVGLAGFFLAGSAPEVELPVLMQLPEFTFTERNGRAVSLHDLAGRVWVANFVFTHCTGPCPLLSAQMQMVQAEVADLEGVRLVSFSVDPDRDTPEVLRIYADGFEAHPERWLFLTGMRHAMYDLIRNGFKLGVQGVAMDHQAHSGSGGMPAPDQVSGSGQILHTLRFALVDREGRVRGYYDGTDPRLPEELAPAVRQLLLEGS
jgi:protein SCO1/2